MARRIGIGTLLAVLVVLWSPAARGAPCAVACKDEVAACHATECQGMRKKALRKCKRACAKTLVRDCYADLSVCGATSARRTPKKPGVGGGGGGTTGGGW